MNSTDNENNGKIINKVMIIIIVIITIIMIMAREQWEIEL